MATRTPKHAVLYLRGMPRRLVREAKAEAARQGITLTAFVSQCLARALGRSASGDAQSLLPKDLRKSAAWFEAHKHELLRQYPGEYVAIVNEGVVDHDRKFDPLARRLFSSFGVRPILVPKLTPEIARGPEIVNIPSPRVVRS